MSEETLFRALFSSGFEKLLCLPGKEPRKRAKKHLARQEAFESLKLGCASTPAAGKIKIEDASSKIPDLLVASKSFDSVAVPLHWKDRRAAQRRGSHLGSLSELASKSASFVSAAPSASPSVLSHLFSQELP